MSQFSDFLTKTGEIFGMVKRKGQGQIPARRQTISPLETKQGQFLEKTLRDRIAGKGLGFSEDFLSATASPFAKSQRAGLQRETIPQIKALSSAAGVGRSTIPVGQAARESTITEESIAGRIANLGLASETLKAQQQSTAIGRFKDLTFGDIASKNLEISLENDFQKAEALRLQGFRTESDTLQRKGVQKSIALVARFGDAFMKKYTGTDMNTSGIIQGNGGGGGGGGGATVNQSSGGMNMSQITSLMSMFRR